MMKKIELLKERIEAKVAVALLTLMAFPYRMKAQSVDFDAGDIESSTESLATAASTIIFSIAGIGGLIGAFVVGKKYMTGDQDAPKALTKWLTGLLIIALAGVIIRFFLGKDSI